MKGIIFDIEEGSIYGSSKLGITFYMKGCPLRCKMCHSPEGQNPNVEIAKLPNGNVKTIGKIWDSNDLASYINKMNSCMDVDFIFSGGEPMMQGEFILDVIENIDGNANIIIDTSGYCIDENLFKAVASKANFINFGLKLIDKDDSIDYTGKSSYVPLKNLFILDKSTHTDYQLVIPMIPGILDTNKHLENVKKLKMHLLRCAQIVINPFNEFTFAKKYSFDV